jgi:hypothetical protein
MVDADSRQATCEAISRHQAYVGHEEIPFILCETNSFVGALRTAIFEIFRGLRKFFDAR